MRDEHTMLPGSDVEFSTPNYGLTTTPAKEWALVVEGGSGCEKAEGKADCVVVTSTRGCCKKGHTQADVRVLRPIAHYDANSFVIVPTVINIHTGYPPL